ncbi:MAG: PAS domain S-box protein [Pseudomonadota bacterium]
MSDTSNKDGQVGPPDRDRLFFNSSWNDARYRQLVEEASLGILSFAKDGRVTEANTAFLRLLDTSHVGGPKAFNVFTFPPFVSSGTADDFRKCLTSAEPITSERWYTASSGKKSYVRLHLTALKDQHGNVTGGEALVDDFTERHKMRAQLRASEQRFRALFESAMELISVLDLNGVVLKTNPAVLFALGYSEEEILGRPMAELVSSKSREVFLCALEPALADRGGRFEVELVRKDRDIVICDSSFSAVRDDKGRITSLLLLQRDVTDKIEAAKRIEDKNRFLNTVIESLNHPFYVMDANTYAVIHANSAAREFFSGEGRACYSVTHGMTSPCAGRDHPCPLDEVKTRKSSASTEHIHYDKEGRPRNVEVHAHPVFDSAGCVSQVIEYSLDITERLETERALKESEEKMRLVIESAPVGIGVVQYGRYRFVNRRFASMFGFDDPETIVGRMMSTFHLDEDRDDLRQSYLEIREGRVADRFHEMTGVKDDGDTIETAVWMTGIQHSGEPAVLVFITDVTEKKRLRAHLMRVQKMDAIGTLAGGIAHDFNNLLQAIQGYAELVLCRMKKPDPGYGELGIILDAARRGGELTRGMLTFSRQLPGKTKPLDLNGEIREVVRLLGRMIPKMIKTELRLAPDLKIVNADPVQMQQVVMNLALNARDAMPDGGTMVIGTKNVVLDSSYCTKHLGTASGEYVLLYVSDTGSGMDREVEERIFEPFFTTKGRGRGSGLGLAVVYGVVKGHGGEVICYSEPGIGTNFKIYLPVVREPAVDVEPEEFPSLAGGNETVLLIDDEAVIRDFGERTLSYFGYKVLTASNGIEGLNIYREKKDEIGLVILDLIMPEMGGRECLREILRLNPDARVLIASGYAANGDIDRMTKEGAGATIEKPYEIRELLSAVRRLLD